ncbi:MAG: deaminase [Candidatus Paceibacterota bacterium]|jgi:dCMP deaminase
MKKKHTKAKTKIIIAYIPVLHEGYHRLFEKHVDAVKLFLLGNEIAQSFVPLAKDIRALPAELIRNSLTAWKRFESVEILNSVEDWKKLTEPDISIIMPDEDVMHELQEKYLPKSKVVFDSIFLRWDKHKSMESRPVEADQTISIKDSDKKIITLLKKEAEKSSDFWRRIGAAIVKDGKMILIRHNHAVPSELLPYVEGDPRSDFHKGVNIELSTVLHAEAGLIADAARMGISLEGAEMYATTFPCPPCAKMIAYSGIKKIYYADGYGVLDGERILKSRGVEIVFVKTE